VAKTSTINKRDRQILGFIAARGEVFFRELEEPKMMAKSTLSKHLRQLTTDKLVNKKISKTRSKGQSCVVYVLTTKGKRVAQANMLKVEDFF
jgi:DNA-binding HxlR family transcriptional regulator